MESITPYNKSKIYLNEIKPLIDQIEVICAKEHMPFAFVCAVKNDEKKTYYERTGEIAKMADVVLKNDYISNVGIAMHGGRFVRENDDGLSDAVQQFDSDEMDNAEEDDELIEIPEAPADDEDSEITGSSVVDSLDF